MTAMIQMSFEDIREEALREVDKFAAKLLAEKGIREEQLKKEMQTWYWKTVTVRGKGGKLKYLEEIHYKGIGVTPEGHIEKRRQAIRDAAEGSSLTKAVIKAKESIHLLVLSLWDPERDPGNNIALLHKKADKADRLADYLEHSGKDYNAASQRHRAKLLRMKAAGKDVEIPRRASGAIDRVRALYAELEKDNLPHARAEYIAVGIAAGINKGTCAVQYARWKREKPDDMPAAQPTNRQTVQPRSKPPWEA